MTEQPVDPGLESARFAAEHGVPLSSVPMTEQEFLGNAPRGITARFAANLGSCTPPAPQAYLPNGHRIRPDLPVTVAAHEDLPVHVYGASSHGPHSAIAAPDRMLLEAEQHAADGTAALSNGELDEGIAWLQAALAFALNYRHAVRFEVTGE